MITRDSKAIPKIVEITQRLQTNEYLREYCWQGFTWITRKQLYKDTWDHNGAGDNGWVQENSARRGFLKNLPFTLVPTSESVGWKYDNIRNKNIYIINRV